MDHQIVSHNYISRDTVTVRLQETGNFLHADNYQNVPVVGSTVRIAYYDATFETKQNLSYRPDVTTM